MVDQINSGPTQHKKAIFDELVRFVKIPDDCPNDIDFQLKKVEEYCKDIFSFSMDTLANGALSAEMTIEEFKIYLESRSARYTT